MSCEIVSVGFKSDRLITDTFERMSLQNVHFHTRFLLELELFKLLS